MKIIIPKDFGGDFKVLLDDGTDITRELGVCEVTVSLKNKENTSAILVVERVEAECDIEDSHVTYEKRHVQGS